MELKLTSIYKSYPYCNALTDVSFSVPSNHIHGLLGPNGAGKTTTMKIISGILKAQSGELRVSGIDANNTPTAIKNLIGYLPEIPPLYLDMRVEEYLQFVANLRIIDKKSVGSSVCQVLEECGLIDVQTKIIGTLSKGYKQRVGLAQALVHRPKILILDEPMSGLDPKAIQDIRSLIVNLKKEHTILLSSHNLHEVEEICDSLTIISGGKIILSGSKQLFFNQIKCSFYIEVDLNKKDEHILPRLRELDFVTDIKFQSSGPYIQAKLFLSEDCQDYQVKIGQKVFELGGSLYQLKLHRPQLENVYMELIHS